MEHQQLVPVELRDSNHNGEEALPSGISVADFDYSVENHLKAMDKMLKLSGESVFDCDQSEIQRMSSLVSFSREWKDLRYKPQAIRFACEGGTRKDVTSGINLTQFSSAAVPKDLSDGKKVSSHLSKDYVMYAGGLIWALDWCPRAHQRPDCEFNLEFIAMATHPPDSSYHKIGAPLTGRGVIQIWSLLISNVKHDDLIPQLKHKSSSSNKTADGTPKRPRGRPRKNPIPVNDPKDPTKILLTDVQPIAFAFPQDSEHGIPTKRKLFSPVKLKSTLTKCKTSEGSSLLSFDGGGDDPMKSSAEKANRGPLEKDIGLPRLVMCLAHNGKVAWDVKWRPPIDQTSKYRMGYLGVLLGNGAVEVWDVPNPRATEAIYSTFHKDKDETDPRFLMLTPIFRCSMIKCGDRQSIPLTMEWSTSSPHDLILAGCHDGVVALWKFSSDGPLKETRPLLCFNADTVPIRALAWAPVVSDSETANIIVTAGHKGVKFWDIRDPFRPLWDVNPVQRTIYGLDWVPDPRCVVLSFDDGEIRIISLSKAACDVAVTGKPFVGTQLQGLNSYHCSSSSIWNVQVSRLTGMVAYCCSDGTVVQFQLTMKAVEKDPRRNREPHYLCGALTMEESVLTIFSPLRDVPFPMKKSANEWSNTPRSRRGFLSTSNQEKRAQEQTLKCQTPEKQPQPESEEQPSFLALCYGNDPGSDSGLEDTLKSKATPKSKKKAKTDDDNKNNTKKCRDEIENAYPPKIVAMHRVRWNMNKGSERWLCYGGAAGILRCQEIT